MAPKLKFFRIPWFIQHKLNLVKSGYFFYANKFTSHLQNAHAATQNQRPSITIRCGFHGNSGAVYAIAHIANLLAKHYHVEFVSTPASNYNCLLNRDVKIVSSPDLDHDLYICDTECEHKYYEDLKAHDKKILITCHGFLDSLHGLDPDYIAKSLSYADHVHLVGALQQQSFKLTDDICFVIPNLTFPVHKKTSTRNIGTVGNLNEARKGADATVEIGLLSNAEQIHLWSAENDKWQNERVVVHEWESDKSKIYDSFDVLVFLSSEETFGMVVIEAMSAGMPCLLSNIPVFEQFGKCPGVELIDVNQRAEASIILNQLLDNKEELKPQLIEYWQGHFSEAAVAKLWLQQLDDILEPKLKTR